MLTPEEVAQYHETGQVTPALRLDLDVISAIEEKVEALFAKRTDFAELDLADSLVEIDRSWIEFGKIPEILDSVEQLLGENLIVWAMECFRKKGERSKVVPWHQDGCYWPIRPLESCTVWIALDHVTPENGCMRIIPGSHKGRRLLTHGITEGDHVNLRQTVAADEMPDVEPVDIVLEPGMISFHDVYTVHGSAPNNSGTRRAGLSVRYMPSSSYYDRQLALELPRAPSGSRH
ncbi:MAG: phytanoyl-CoA dioxygenase family protein [Alphaproteobacteria bacterium]|nr:phytanoyl-CoA dioxygenase family protein [Alphaproteobacteria bacterium]